MNTQNFTISELAKILIWCQLVSTKIKLDETEIKLLDKIRETLLNELKIRNTDATTI